MTDADPDRSGDATVPPPASTEWSPEVGDEGGSTPLPPFLAGAVKPASGTWEKPPAMPAEDEPFPFEEMETFSDPGVAEREDFRTDEPGRADAGGAWVGVEEEEDDFPVEAFDVPGLRAGNEGSAPAPAASPGAMELADRLERLAGDLRSRGTQALTNQLAGGDRFDALLTGMLAGFLAAREE